MAHDILLEAGTNEMELLSFKANGTCFGVNIAKVREIISDTSIIQLPLSDNAVDGCIKLRDKIITLINLSKYFGGSKEKGSNKKETIILEFNDTVCGIEVDEVCRIYRIKWSDIMPPSKFLTNIDAPVTGMVLKEEQIIQVIDLEDIVGKILHQNFLNQISNEITCTPDISHAKILMADDSNIVRNTFSKQLAKAGFNNVTICENGQDACDTIFATKDHPDEHFDIILSDIEMPRMDGLHLCKRIKDEIAFKKIPVILISSLIIDENINKGSSVGANAQIKKSDSKVLINTMEKLLKSGLKTKTA